MTNRMAVPNVVERKTLDYIPDYIHRHVGKVVSFNRTLGGKIKKGIGIWNKNQMMSIFQFYLYIAGSLHVSGPQAHPQESSHSCSHNHWFGVCTALAVCSVCWPCMKKFWSLNFTSSDKFQMTATVE